MDYRGRQQRLIEDLRASHLDALLVTHLPNIHYLCGFTGSSGALLVTEGRSVFFTDGRYAEQANAEVQGSQVRIVRKSALAAAARSFRTSRVRRIGLEAAHLTVAERA